MGGEDKRYLRLLIKPGNVRKAVKSLLCLVEGKHPDDPDKSVDAKLVLAAAQTILDRAIPAKGKVDYKVEHTHSFTEISLEPVAGEKEKQGNG